MLWLPSNDSFENNALKKTQHSSAYSNMPFLVSTGRIRHNTNSEFRNMVCLLNNDSLDLIRRLALYNKETLTIKLGTFDMLRFMLIIYIIEYPYLNFTDVRSPLLLVMSLKKKQNKTYQQNKSTVHSSQLNCNLPLLPFRRVIFLFDHLPGHF